MPILQEIADPYAESNAQAFNGLIGGGGIKAQAEAQELAARIKYTNQQQLHLAQQMRLEQQKQGWEAEKFGWDKDNHSRTLNDEKAIGDYWNGRSNMPAPIGTVPGQSNNPAAGAQPSDPAAAAREAAYWAAVSRATTRGAHGHDLATGLDQVQRSYERQHPQMPSQGSPSNTFGVTPPTMPAGLGPDAQEAWQKNAGTEVLKSQTDIMNKQLADRTAAARKIPELMQLRDKWEEVSHAGGVGSWSGGAIGRGLDRYVPGIDRSDAEQKRLAYESQLNSIMSSPDNRRPGEGSVSNYERELFGKPFPAVHDQNAESGREKISNLMRYTFGNLGVPDAQAVEIAQHVAHGAPREMVDDLIAHLQQGNPHAVQQFLSVARELYRQRYSGQFNNGGR
jgi:hypothetical protein